MGSSINLIQSKQNQLLSSLPCPARWQRTRCFLQQISSTSSSSSKAKAEKAADSRRWKFLRKAGSMRFPVSLKVLHPGLLVFERIESHNHQLIGGYPSWEWYDISPLEVTNNLWVKGSRKFTIPNWSTKNCQVDMFFLVQALLSVDDFPAFLLGWTSTCIL